MVTARVHGRMSHSSEPVYFKERCATPECRRARNLRRDRRDPWIDRIAPLSQVSPGKNESLPLSPVPGRHGKLYFDGPSYSGSSNNGVQIGREIAWQADIMKFIQLLAIAGLAAADVPSDCPAYDNYAAQRHPPYSSGKWKYPYQRPESRCRSYVVPEVEQTLTKVKRMIKDTDLYSLFVNTWPNTVDTTILWHGKALDDPDEEVPSSPTNHPNISNQTYHMIPCLIPSLLIACLCNNRRHPRHVAPGQRQPTPILQANPQHHLPQHHQQHRQSIPRHHQPPVAIYSKIPLLQRLPTTPRLQAPAQQPQAQPPRQARRHSQPTLRSQGRMGVQIRTRFSVRVPPTLMGLLRRHSRCQVFPQIQMG